MAGTHIWGQSNNSLQEVVAATNSIFDEYAKGAGVDWIRDTGGHMVGFPQPDPLRGASEEVYWPEVDVMTIHDLKKPYGTGYFNFRLYSIEGSTYVWLNVVAEPGFMSNRKEKNLNQFLGEYFARAREYGVSIVPCQRPAGAAV